jgi:hypothetical protein
MQTKKIQKIKNKMTTIHADLKLDRSSGGINLTATTFHKNDENATTIITNNVLRLSKK